MLTDEYIAGFFDGEGCIRFNNHKYDKNKYYLEVQLSITSTDKEVLEEIKEHLNCGKIYETGNHSKGHKHCYRLRFNKKSDMLTVLKKLYPYSRIKKEILKETIDFLESK